MNRGLKNRSGFTLVELAIVLVIIGIIMGAVVKGLDLIENARHKKFVAKVKEWENVLRIFYDRKGRLPGDSDRNGKIDKPVKTDLVNNIHLIYPPYEVHQGEPQNTITIGSHTFYVYFGTHGGENEGKNIMIICVSQDCRATVGDEGKLNFFEALDTAIDGISHGKEGQVVGTQYEGPDDLSQDYWYALYKATDLATYWGPGIKALIYYFDSKR